MKNHDYYHSNGSKAIADSSPSFTNLNANNNQLERMNPNKATNVLDNNSQTSLTVVPKENEAAT